MPRPSERFGNPASDGSTTGTINTPGLTSSLKPQRRAISDAKQARALTVSLEAAAKERNLRNARIAAKVNSEKPFKQVSLEADGLGWKSNFTTQPLSMLVNKVTPRLRKALEAVKYLTNSMLPDNVPGNAVKSEMFRREITKLVRSRPGWDSFLTEVFMEDVLYGYAIVAWLDEFGWMPEFFRQDMGFVPTGTKQEASGSQVLTLRKKYLIHELFSLIEDQDPSMADAAAFFSFEYGNGTMHGSKGIGRQIYSMAAMLDRARNEIVDRLNLAGKIIIQGDDKALRRFKMSVVGNAILIGQGYQITERKIDPGIENFLQLDQFLTSLLDQLAGAVTPKALEGERVTAAAVNLLAGREEESRDNITARALGQFATMLSTMQKRICSPDVTDEDAKAFQKKMLEFMTREELTQLSQQPVAETVADYTEIERQKIVVIAAEGRGNPLYNQKELERRKLTAQVDEEFADAVLLPDNDPTVQAEQTRLQQLELMLIAGQGTDVPISPRDNHLIHLGVLIPAMEQAAQVAAQDPGGVAI